MGLHQPAIPNRLAGFDGDIGKCDIEPKQCEGRSPEIAIAARGAADDDDHVGEGLLLRVSNRPLIVGEPQSGDDIRAGRRAQLLYCEAKTVRSEEHTSELQSLMRISYDVFC